MIYAVSDIHGRWEKYRALLERLSREDPDYTLYLLGDSIDRGKGGCRILLDAMKRPNVLSLLGNHEFSAAVCLPWLLQDVTEETRRRRPFWTTSGTWTSMPRWRPVAAPSC